MAICPIVSGPIPGEPLGLGHVEIHCTQTQCAWWLEDVSMCAVKDIALELQHLQHRLADMAEKMPRNPDGD